jgi:outer membrane biosynthesis protein TonB
MNNEFFNILAIKDEDWIQILIFVAIFAFAVLKKIFSGVKSFMEQQNQENERNMKEYAPSTQRKYTYTKDDFKTIEQIRDEKISQIRAAYGIPEPKKITIPRPEYEQQQASPVEQELPPEPAPEPIREQMFAPPPAHEEPVYSPPPVYRPKIKKQKPQPKPVETHDQQAKHKAKETQPQGRELIVHLASAEDLRAAVIYQEILGKPLALRD